MKQVTTSKKNNRESAQGQVTSKKNNRESAQGWV
jgi:hypothetical protein